nr:unnamed protein product [Naegleria fowleri]
MSLQPPPSKATAHQVTSETSSLKIKSLSDALIREYLNKMGFKETLKMFDKENHSISSRKVLSSSLNLHPTTVMISNSSSNSGSNNIEISRTSSSSFIEQLIMERVHSRNHPICKSNIHSTHDDDDHGAPQDMISSRRPCSNKRNDAFNFGNNGRGVDHKDGTLNSTTFNTTTNSPLPKQLNDKQLSTTATSNTVNLDIQLEDVDDTSMMDSTSVKTMSNGGNGSNSSNGGNSIAVKTTSKIIQPSSSSTTLNDPSKKKQQQLSKYSYQHISNEDLKKLKKLLIGSSSKSSSLPSSWIQQGIYFYHHESSDDDIFKYGIVQNEGGPCGVLAVIQSFIIRNYYFKKTQSHSEQYSKFTNDMFMMNQLHLLVDSLYDLFVHCVVRSRSLSTATTTTTTATTTSNTTTTRTTRTTATRTTQSINASTTSCFKMVKFQVHDPLHDSFEKYSISYCTLNGLDHVYEYLENLVIPNVNPFSSFYLNPNGTGLISYLCSILFSIGLDECIQQMSNALNSSFIVEFGYCSQELVNLLLIGYATSYVHDDDDSSDHSLIEMNKELINSKTCPIGFLTILEYYDHVRVGNCLKHPTFPIWVVDFESHYSVLFEKEPNELYYYDQFMKQEGDIHLSLKLHQNNSAIVTTTDSTNNDIPLENVIRTRWKNCSIDWNGTEPLL